MSTTKKKDVIKHENMKYRGYSYDGFTKNGKPHGQGFLRKGRQDDNSVVYQGHFKDGKYEHGTIFPDEINGILGYIGEFKEGVRDGYGTLYKKDYRKPLYDGEFKDGEYNGLGVLYDDNGEIVFNGRFKNGKPVTPTSHLNPSKKTPSKKGGKKRKTSKYKRKTSLKKSRKYKKN